MGGGRNEKDRRGRLCGFVRFATMAKDGGAGGKKAREREIEKERKREMIFPCCFFLTGEALRVRRGLQWSDVWVGWHG